MKVSLILCEKSDDTLKNYINVFDKIVVGKNKELSFTIITNLEEEDCDKDLNEFVLHYFLVFDKKKYLYLSEVECIRQNEDSDDISSFKNEMKDIPVPYEGKYEVQAIRNDNMKDCDGSQGKEIITTGQLVARAEFEIELRNC